jgi:hypothetical protein
MLDQPADCGRPPGFIGPMLDQPTDCGRPLGFIGPMMDHPVAQCVNPAGAILDQPCLNPFIVGSFAEMAWGRDNKFCLIMLLPWSDPESNKFPEVDATKPKVPAPIDYREEFRKYMESTYSNILQDLENQRVKKISEEDVKMEDYKAMINNDPYMTQDEKDTAIASQSQITEDNKSDINTKYDGAKADVENHRDGWMLYYKQDSSNWPNDSMTQSEKGFQFDSDQKIIDWTNHIFIE